MNLRNKSSEILEMHILDQGTNLASIMTFQLKIKASNLPSMH